MYYRICTYKSKRTIRIFSYKNSSFIEPTSNIVQHAMLNISKDDIHIFFMLFFLVSSPQVRRISKHKHLFLLGMRTHLFPIQSASIAALDLVDVLQRQGSDIHAEVGVELVVHLMLGKPEGEHRHLVGEVEQFNAIELVETDAGTIDEVEHLLGYALLAKAQDVHLQEAQLLVGDNQEIATAARRVEELHLAHAPQQSVATLDDGLVLHKKLIVREHTHIVEISLLVVEVGEFLVFRTQVVHKERIDYLHDVRHTGVVHTLLGTHIGIHHRLNHTAEDVGVDVLPVQFSTLYDDFPRLAPHLGNRDVGGEETSVDVWEGVDFMGQVLGAVFLVYIHHAERRTYQFAQVGTVLLGEAADEIGKEVFLEDARVLGKEAE